MKLKTCEFNEFIEIIEKLYPTYFAYFSMPITITNNYSNSIIIECDITF